ncbi:MAG TPA: glycosyltransferase family 4 protein [Blastocatellia bacterium]|nr:glycosyltransferase family 4 protein [Blastocatellia bacterium]HMX25593.1 glycosyltransferase family 4 protein [Blastocatellia bacterium]HMY76382.1 glycosyltransferase family 4 protein [Blastocatellia bacterium]
MNEQAPKLNIFVSHSSELLTDCRSHGDGLLAFAFLRRLAERGHTLHVAVQETEIEGDLPANLKLYPIHTRFRGRITQRLEYMLKSRLLFNRLRRRHRFDLIHQLNPVVKGLSLSMLGCGLPVVLGLFYPNWPADADEAEPKLGLAARIRLGCRALLRKLALRCQQRQASALVLATPKSLDALYKPERVKEKIFLVNQGVDAEYFSPGADRSSGDNNQHILFVANLWRRKGILTLLEAFEKVAECLPDSRLTVVGSGGIEEEVHRRADALRCRSRITFIKHISRERLPAALRDCTVYCLPSNGEPLGGSMLEAMACGKPVVATDAGGLGLLVREEGGRKAPPRNAQALAEALIEILEAPALQARMGKFNRRLIEEHHAWHRVIEQLESVYRIVLNRKHDAKNKLTANPSLIAESPRLP